MAEIKQHIENNPIIPYYTMTLRQFVNAVYAPNYYELVELFETLDNKDGTANLYFRCKHELDLLDTQRTYLLIRRRFDTGQDLSYTLITPEAHNV